MRMCSTSTKTTHALRFSPKTYFCQTIEFVLRNMKKRNDDNLDNLDGLGGMLPAEVLKMLNELLEQQQRAGHTNNGSKIEIVYVAPGGQHVDTIQSQIIASPCPPSDWRG